MEYPQDISAQLIQIADKLDASTNPSRTLVASALNEVLASVERTKDKDKKKEKKQTKKEIDSSTASSIHMGLLERYKDFHDTGNSLIGFRGLIDEIGEDSPADVLAAREACEQAFAELDAAMRKARSCYSSLMASLAMY